METASRIPVKPLALSNTQPRTSDGRPAGNRDTWGEATSKFLSEEAPARPSPSAPATDYAETFRHSSWKPFRIRVMRALETTPNISPRRAAAFRYCGCDAHVEIRRHFNTGAIVDARIKSTKCHDRFCVPCAAERSNRIREALMFHMHGRQNLKLVTLTLKASTAPLTDILDRITKAFRTLRLKPLWTKNVQGGVAIIETKIGAGSGQWHVHFHVIAESKYIPQKELSALWLRITGDSEIVDIRPVGALGGAVQYITKYITKAADHSIVMSPKHLSEAITGFTGRRLVTTFGTWRGLQLMEKPPDEENTITGEGWRPMGSLHDLIRLALTGDADACTIIRKLKPREFEGRPPRPPDDAAPF